MILGTDLRELDERRFFLFEESDFASSTKDLLPRSTNRRERYQDDYETNAMTNRPTGFTFTSTSPKRAAPNNSSMRTLTGKEAITPSTARATPTAAPPPPPPTQTRVKSMAAQFGMTPSSARATPTAVASSRMQQQHQSSAPPPPRTQIGMTPSSARQTTPSATGSFTAVPPSTTTMDIIQDYSNEDDEDEDESNSSGNNFSVIIGKTFEAMSLPDGSQQIIETTKYKRLKDGCIYATSKVRSLDEEDYAPSSVAMGLYGVRDDSTN